MDKHYLKADFLLLLVTFIAAAGWIFSKETLEGLPPLLFIGLRFLLAGTILMAMGVQPLKTLSRKQWRHAITAGLLFALAMIFWIQGLNNAKHVGEGAFITSMGIVLVPIIARLFFSETPSAETWIALPLAILGLAFLSLDHAFSFASGQFFFLIAALLLATHFTVISQLVTNISPLSLTSIQLVMVGLCALATSGVTEPWPSSVESKLWLWFLASALIATSLRFWLQTKAQSFAPASHAVLILTLEPVWTALLASFWFDEIMTHFQLIGCCLIFSALMVSRWRWIKSIFSQKNLSPKETQ